VFKFHDDPTVNEPGIVVLLKQVGVYMGKRESFEKRIRKNETERKMKHRNYRQYEN